MQRKLLVLGAGAAGLTAAIFAAEQGAQVLLLERTKQAGKKILMSGGTRCNVLPVKATLQDYHTASSPNILKKIFKTWSVAGCKRWFTDELGLQLACEEESNKWFPVSNSAKEVRDLLLQRALDVGVEIRYECAAEALEPLHPGWQVRLVSGEVVTGDAVIVATGGLSVPTIGTDGMGHRFLKPHGHLTGPVYPALTPLLSTNAAHKGLSGLSLNVRMRVMLGDKRLFEASRTGFLFTHRGYSGPAVLDVSHFYREEFAGKTGIERAGLRYEVSWDGEGEEVWKERLGGKGGATVSGILRQHLPNRLADVLAAEAGSGLGERKAAELSREERKRLLKLLTACELPVSGDEGYRKAEVTGGGVPLEEINPATMESRLHPGLYLCGEITDVFGRIGGFNFYWAWVSGRLAGMKAGEKQAGGAG
ncbi:MAG: aminoacetone oxidase family FAD-binding enzyme [Balneolales bacterium]|nr:aminoacetone oxidase family FAD-binding enzyme [Balneolales bacterium]